MTLSFGPTQTLAVAAAAITIGHQLVLRVPFFARYNFPGAILGGFALALVFYFAKLLGLGELAFDRTFQEPLMIAFFASVGYAASWRALRAGGKSVFVFFLISVAALLLQGAIGLLIAHGLHLHLLTGVLTGPVALTGGPGTALAFAPLFETAGIVGAGPLGLSAALGGILIGGLIGSPIGTLLIERHSLKNPHKHHGVRKNREHSPTTPPLHSSSSPVPFDPESIHEAKEFDPIVHVLAVAFILGIGSSVSSWITSLGVTLPVYIGAMIVAALARNADDRFGWFKLSDEKIESIGSVALSLFIAIATVTLDFSKLQSAAFSLVVFLFLQTALVVFLAYYFVHRFSGNDYEAAVISSGFVGFMMGTTANAMANMNAISKKYGPAPRAFLAVPLVGACFIDFVNAAVITMAVAMLS